MAKKPCCAADALRRIGGQCERDYQRFHHAEDRINEMKEPRSAEEHDGLDPLTKQVKSNNIVPPGVQEAYTEAIMREYHAARKNG